MMCSKCHENIAEWDNLCQECWESYTSDLWWASYGGIYATNEYQELLER
jgi:predicted amidophosphoribosyltransferase